MAKLSKIQKKIVGALTESALTEEALIEEVYGIELGTLPDHIQRRERNRLRNEIKSMSRKAPVSKMFDTYFLER